MKKRARLYSILVCTMMLMYCFLQPAVAVTENISFRLAELSSGSKSVVYTASLYGNTSTNGDGTKNNPYNRFEDALKNVADGGTIYIGSPYGFINSSDNSPLVIDKNITIKGQGNSLSVRKAGIVLGADVKFENVTLSFGHKYHDAIFANGHTLTLENVICDAGGRSIDIFGGGLHGHKYELPSSGNDARIIINGSSSGFGNIYAGSMNGTYNGNTTITMAGVKDMEGGIIYASGALETYVDFDNFFDLEEPAPPVEKPDTYTVSGTVTIALNNCNTSHIYGSGAGRTNVEYTSPYRNNHLLLVDIDKLTVKNGSVLSPNFMTGNPAVVLEGASTIDFSQIDLEDDLSIASLTGSGANNKLILSKEGLLKITGELAGDPIIFEAENGYNGNSGVAAYGHTYVTTGGGSGSFTFTPFVSQGDMKLNREGNLWKTNAQSEDYYEPLYLESFNVENKTFIISKDIINGWNASAGGNVASTIEPFKVSFTWPDIYSPDEYLLLEFVPINYEVKYNDKIYKATLKDDYSAYISELGIEFSGVSSASDDTGTTGTIYVNIHLPGDGATPKPIEAGNYEITIMPASKNGHFSETVTLTVVEGNGKQEQGTTINATTTTAKILKDNADVTFANFNDKVNFEVTVKSNNVNPEDSEVKLYINGKEYNQKQTTSSGTATFTDVEVNTENGFKSGNNEITVMYSGTKDADGNKTVSGASMQTLQLTVNEISGAKLDEASLGQQSKVYSGVAVEYELANVNVVDDKGNKLSTVNNPTIKYKQNDKEVTPVLPGIYDVFVSVPAGANHPALSTTVTGALNILTAEPHVALTYSLDADGNLTLEAKVTGVSEASVPLGTVQFYKDDTICGVSTLSFGEASVEIKGLTQGEHTFYALYSPVYTQTSPYSGKNSENVKVNIQQQAIAVTGVTIDETKIVKVGEAVKLVPTIAPAGVTNNQVSWVSQQPEIATVASDGTVTGLKQGKAYIVVTTVDGGYSDTCEVTVNENTGLSQTTSISLDKTSVNINLGTSTKTATIKATTMPANGNVIWSTSDSGVATVKDGIITGVGNGTATITVRSMYGNVSATCTVNVTGGEVQPSSVLISPRAGNLQIGGVTEITLKATVYPGTASQQVIWESSNTAIATVNNGKVTAVSAGTAIISAKTGNGIIDAITVTVQPKAVIPVQRVALSQSSLSIYTGGTAKLTATVSPGNATNKAVSWSSSNTGVATVDNNGNIKAVGVGSAIITVTTKDGGYKAQCTVYVQPKGIAVLLSKGSGNIGEKISVTGYGAKQYKFVWSYNNWEKWGIIKNMNTTSVASFTPTIPGVYNIYMDAMDGTGKIVTKTINYTANSNYNVSLNVNAVNPVQGGNITATANATGNTTGLKYKFVWSYNNWSKWGVLSPAGTTKSVSFKPMAGEGNYDIYLDVIDAYGNVTTKSVRKYVGLSAVSTISASKTSAVVGDSITLTANSTGIGARYKLVWCYNNSWDEWYVIKPMNSTKAFTFTPKKAGRNTIYMDVMDSYGNTYTKSININVTLGWSINSITLSSSVIKLGDALTATVNVSGEKASGVKYKFVWSYNNWSNWGIIQNGTGKNGKFSPSKPGKYELYVDAYDGYGNVITKKVAFTVNP